MAHGIFFHNKCCAYSPAETVRLKESFRGTNASDVTMRYLLRANTTSRKEIRASNFNAYWARSLGNSFFLVDGF